MKRKNKSNIILMFLFFSLLVGCEAEFDPLLDFKSTPVVYGLLNHKERIHYIRISNTYDQSILESPKKITNEPDSYEVWMEFWKDNDIAIKPFLLQAVDHTTQLSGSNNTDHLVFSTDIQFFSNLTGKLLIKNLETNTCLSAICKTFSIDDLNLSYSEYFTKIDFKTLAGVYFYELKLNFHFVEVTDSDTIFKYLEYSAGNTINVDLDPDINLQLDLSQPDFFSFLGSKIPVSKEITRYTRANPLEYILFIGDRNLFDYNAQSPTEDSLIQSGQYNGNINGGYGIFCCYDIKSLFTIAMHSQWYNRLISETTIKDLNFKPYPWKD